MLKNPNHPLAQANGWVFEHRAVLFERFGPQAQECHWCGVSLEWDAICIDHLNEDKGDNRPENLVISCNRCNRARGAMLPFIRAMKAGSLQDFIRTIGLMRT
jgi:hypothetical protein